MTFPCPVPGRASQPVTAHNRTRQVRLVRRQTRELALCICDIDDVVVRRARQQKWVVEFALTWVIAENKFSPFDNSHAQPSC